MCRAGPVPPRRDRRIHPADVERLHQSFGKASLKARALNELYPVTGRPSNVRDDYVLSPIVLGEGHYGRVRECVHRATGRTLACKSIEKSRVSRIDHLRREVQLLSEIRHPRVLGMADRAYEDATHVHIVTEKCAGGELFDGIVANTTERGCYPEDRAARIVGSLLEALVYLHERGIAHRDIKPENILFETKGGTSIRLIDFGLSRRHRDGEEPMTNPVGTAYYMSPELLKRRYDKSTDVWSVGTIVYILLCGYPPFNGETDADIFESIGKGRFDFSGRQWDGKSNEVKDFIRCLLRKDPHKRFTAKEALRHPWIVNEGRKAPRRRAWRGLRQLRSN